jgi:hypothetical protein
MDTTTLESKFHENAALSYVTDHFGRLGPLCIARRYSRE